MLEERWFLTVYELSLLWPFSALSLFQVLPFLLHPVAFHEKLPYQKLVTQQKTGEAAAVIFRIKGRVQNLNSVSLQVLFGTTTWARDIRDQKGRCGGRQQLFEGPSKLGL